MRISDLFRDISELFSRPRNKCSKCQRPYNDFVIDFDTGTIKCVGCGSSADIFEELGRDQAVFILDAILQKGPTSETRAQAEQLKNRIKAT